MRLPRDLRGPEVVYGTHVDHFDRAPRQLTPLPSLLQARARCCAARVGKLVVDKAFPVDFPAERGQDGLRGSWAATGRGSGRQPTRHRLAGRVEGALDEALYLGVLLTSFTSYC